MTEIKKANGHRFTGLGHPGEADVDPGHRARPEDYAFDLEGALSVTFALNASVPADAYTARTLGTEREGNGVLIDTDGHVLTVGYLVMEAERVTLTDRQGRRIEAQPVGFDQVTGFGLVRAEAAAIASFLSFGSAAALAEGDPVVVAGHGGLRQALVAEVASKREFAGYWEYLLDEAIFTAPPHPRWSGAALLGRDGRLYGIGSLFVQDAAGGSAPLSGNMFVPIDLLPPILEDLKSLGRVDRAPRPWLGVYVTPVEGKLVIAGISDGSPAAEGNLNVGDIVLGVAGEPVDDLAAFYRRVWGLGPAGVEVPFDIYREDRLFEVRVRSADRFSFLKGPVRH